MNKYGYIYCTTDLKNGMKYIGQKKSDVFIQTYKGSGRIIRNKLKNNFDRFRVDLIEWCYSKEELNKCEEDWTKAVGLYPLSYNLRQGGMQSGLSDDTRKKISIAQKGKTRGKYSEERKNNISKSLKGVKHNWKIEPSRFRGKNHTKEAKDKIKERSLGSHWYTNGIINKFVKQCPEGFYNGKTLSQKEIESYKYRRVA